MKVEIQDTQKKVLYIESEPSLIVKQKENLSEKGLEGNLFSFLKFDDAFHFMESHLVKEQNKLHYVIVDEMALDGNFSNSINRLYNFKEYLKRLEIIVITDKAKVISKNHIMQYPFVSVFMIKPYPSNYIEFLITGKMS